MNKKIFLIIGNLIFIFIFTFFLCMYNFFININNKAIVLLIFFLLIVGISIIKNQIIIFLFLVSLFIFQYGNLLLNTNNLRIFGFINYKISKETIILIYNLLFFNLSGIFFALITKDKIKKTFFNKNNNHKDNNQMIKIIIIFAIISFFPYIYNNFKTYLLYKTNYSYVDLYSIKIIGSNIFIRIIGSLYYPSILIGLSLFDKRKKYFIFFISNLLIYGIIGSVYGARNILIQMIFFIICYYYILYEKKIKLKNYFIICILGVVLIYFSQFMSENRNKTNVSLKQDTIKTFVYNQGITGLYLALLFDYPNLFDREIPYIFSSIFGEKEVKSKEKILASGNIKLEKQLSARVNYSFYEKGYGMGGNYIIEMYDFGKKLGVFILSFLHILFIKKVYRNNIKKYNLLYRILLLYYLNTVYFITPRASYFPDIFSIRLLEIFILFLFLSFLDRFLKNVIIWKG